MLNNLNICEFEQGDFLNYNETLEYIHSLGNFLLPASLERIKTVLNCCGNPQNDFKSIHVAGTNGKGSVCAMVSNIFKTAGYKTGLFISPFIINFRERIQINGEFISEENLINYALRIKKTNVKLTEFEFITALAFLYFKDEKIDVLICETGLGGRLDATNILENSVCTAITKIGLDHTSVLGDTIEKITAEKCGILRSCPTITSPYQSESALNVIKSKTDNLIIPDISKLEIIDGDTYVYKNKKIKLSLTGDFQIENSLIAIEVVMNSGYDITYDEICDGLNNTFFPARLEIFSHNPMVILDGAHNPDGAEVLAKELMKLKEKPVAVIGMMKDKNISEVLKKTLKYCKSAFAVTICDNPRALSAEELSEIANNYCPTEIAHTLDSALSKTDDEPTVIFGSLYLASAVRPLLLKKFKKN